MLWKSVTIQIIKREESINDLQAKKPFNIVSLPLSVDLRSQDIIQAKKFRDKIDKNNNESASVSWNGF